MSIKAKISADGTQYVKTLEKLRGQTKKFGGDIKKTFVGAFAATAIVSGLRSIFNEMVEVQRAADRFGMSAEQMQRWAAVGRQVGADMEKVADVMKDLDAKTTDAILTGAEFGNRLREININIEEFAKLSPEDKMLALADAVKDADAAVRRFTLDEINDSAFQLEEAFQMGSEALRKLMADADVYTDKATAAAAASAVLIENTIQKVKTFLGNALVEVVKFLEFYGAGFSAFFEQVQKNMDLMAQGRGDEIASPFKAAAKAQEEVLEKQRKQIELAQKQSALQLGYEQRVEIEERILKLQEQRAEAEKAASLIGLSGAEKLEKLKREEKSDAAELIKLKEQEKSIQQEIAKLLTTDESKLSDKGGMVGEQRTKLLKTQESIEAALLELTKKRASISELELRVIEDQKRAAQDLADIYEQIAEAQGRPGAGGDVEAAEKAIMARVRAEQEAQTQETEAAATREGGAAIIDVHLQELDAARKEVEKLIQESYGIDIGIEYDEATTREYEAAVQNVREIEEHIAGLREKEQSEIATHTAQSAALADKLAQARKKEADALAKIQAPDTADPVAKMQAASEGLLRMEKDLVALRKKAMEDGKVSAEEQKAIAENELELVQKIAAARAETTQIRGEIAATREAGEEAGMSDIEKLEAANKRQEQLEGQLAALEKAADADGRRTAEEELAIAQKRLEIEQGIADAKTVIAGAKEEIESRRRAREEEALTPEELLARREQESAAAREALRKEKIKAAQDGAVTETEGAIIATKELDVEKALDAERAAREALEGGNQPGVIASSLAAIGGGGGVAAFGGDPLLSENQKQTRVLEAIRDGLKGKELETANNLERPEL